MAQDHFDRSIFEVVNHKAIALEEHLSTDVIFYNGSIYPQYFRSFRDFVEQVKAKSNRTENAVSVMLMTGGGSAETTERMDAVLRKQYETVNFIVPDIAIPQARYFAWQVIKFIWIMPLR